MLVLPKNLSRLSDLAATQIGKDAMNGVRVKEYEDSYRLEVTDGRTLLVVRGPNVGADVGTATKLAANLEDAPDGTFVGTIPAKEWGEAFKGTKKDDVVGLVMGDDGFAFAFGNQMLRGALVEGRYPNVDSVLPAQRPLASVAIDPKLLAELLLTMAPLVEKVTLHFYHGEGRNGFLKPLGMTGHNEHGQFVDAIIMPLFEDKVAMDAKEVEDPAPTV
jgi:DNA polymerase III sliding clamp (beta) subunit (PCNA family)